MALVNPTYAPEIQTERLIVDALSGWYNQTKAALDNLTYLTWHNPFGLSADEVFALLKTDGVSLLDCADGLKRALEIGVPTKPLDEFVPADREAKHNPDGTVTVAVKKAG